LKNFKNVFFILKQAKFKVLNENEAIIKTPLQQQNTKKALLAKLGSRAPNSITQLKKTWGVGCELCTIVLNAAKYLLENKMEDEKILSFIETQLCARLGEYNQTCVAYVREEGEIVFDMLAKSVDPALICRGMGLCLKVQVSDEFVNEKFFDLQVRNPLNCTLCKLVINQVKQMLTDNKKQAEILNYIDTNLCAKVGKTKELCKSLIDAYGPLFLEIIARDVNPAQLCSMLGMCESSTIQTISIGFIDLEVFKNIFKSFF
jgi:saposin